MRLLIKKVRNGDVRSASVQLNGPVNEVSWGKLASKQGAS